MRRKIAIITIVFAIAVFVGNIALGLFLSSKKTSVPKLPEAPVVTQPQRDTFWYRGEDGKDALTLLKEKAGIEQDKSGLVVSIKGRKANSAKREYWAFYLNGKLASVGPAEYQTKDGERIEWKVEKY